MMKKTLSLCVLSMLVLGGLVQCSNDPTKSVIQNRDPNGTSQLQLTMRDMYDYFEEVKKQLDQGKAVDDIKAFEHLLTDTPTERGKNRTEIYQALAKNYLIAVETMNSDKNKEAFKGIVDACMSCHQKVCPGPMVKIKKLYNAD